MEGGWEGDSEPENEINKEANSRHEGVSFEWMRKCQEKKSEKQIDRQTGRQKERERHRAKQSRGG